MRSLVSTRAAFAVLGVALAWSAVGCAAGPGKDADDLDPQASVTSNLTGCSATRAQILASASPGRRVAVERGFAWLDDNVPYSQSAQHEGYRTDCSGFVSMCWNLGRSSNTSAFYSGDANTRLGSYEDLVVADAMVKQGHILMFLGWNDAAHQNICVLEQSSTANDMQFRVRTRSSLTAGGYKAIRAKSLVADVAPPPAEDPTEDPDLDPPDIDIDIDDEPIDDEPTTTTDDVETPPAQPDNSKVSTQSEAEGDPGDSGDDADADDEEDDTSSKSSKRKRSSSDDSDSVTLNSAGCSTTSGQPAGHLASWAPLLGVLLVLSRRRRG